MTGRPTSIAYRIAGLQDCKIAGRDGRTEWEEGCQKDPLDPSCNPAILQSCNLYAGLRNRISRRLFWSRKESETRRPWKRRMMSRVSRIAWRPRAAGYH